VRGVSHPYKRRGEIIVLHILIVTFLDNTDDFKVDRGLKQGDVISTILFNIVLEYVISRLTITPKGTILTG
jgi:hypothetical protein